jgi:O-antigen ligase
MSTKRATLPQFWQKSTFWAFWAAGAILAILLASLIITRTDQILIFAATLILALLTAKNLKIGLYIIIFLPFAGELVRLPFGPGDGILISDVAIPVFLGIWLLKNFFSTQKTTIRTSINLPFTLFIIIGALSLLQSLLFLTPSETISGSLYLIRYLIYGLLYFAVFSIIKTEKDFRSTLKMLTISALLLAIAGFIQLQIFPDLAELEELGWDPHINRLVSTWLDPNFVGGLLAFMSSILLGITLHLKKTSHKIGLITIIAILAAALFLTYSRSAYLAFGAGVIIISLLKSRKLLIIGLILTIIGIASSERAQERTAELTQSVTSIFTETAQTPDPTAKLRIKSWEQTLYLIQKRPLLGSGYNTLRSVNHREGFVTGTDIHSASGSDSSLLTILATTGILGFIPFLAIYIIAIRQSFKNWRNKSLNPLYKGFSLGLLGAIPALLIHSVFVNSLLFPQILIFFWICLALLERTKHPNAGNAP